MTMKRIIIILITLVLFSFLLIIYMINNDNKYYKSMKNDIIKNTELDYIDYINKYDNYYIVADNDYLYLIDIDYNMILDIELSSIYENTNDYDIIYKDSEFMYFNDYMEDNKLVYEYYDLYTYESIDRVLVGG